MKMEAYSYQKSTRNIIQQLANRVFMTNHIGDSFTRRLHPNRAKSLSVLRSHLLSRGLEALSICLFSEINYRN